MKLYRIFTESTGRMGDRAIDIMGEAFSGFTVLSARGYWDTHPEPSIVLEYHGKDTDRERVLLVASRIRDANGQQAVCVQILDVDLVSVTA